MDEEIFAEARAFIKERDEVIARDLADRDRAELALRPKWEEEYIPTIRLINQHLDSLPQDKRAEIEQRVTKDGGRALNDPEVLKQLAQEARRAPEWLGEIAQKHNGNERAALESLMGDRNSRYWRGPDSERAQAYYRDLTREAERTKEDLALRYSKADFERDLAHVREHRNEPGFEKRQIEKSIRQGLSPNAAHAVVDYFKAHLRE